MTAGVREPKLGRATAPRREVAIPVSGHPRYESAP